MRLQRKQIIRKGEKTKLSKTNYYLPFPYSVVPTVYKTFNFGEIKKKACIIFHFPPMFLTTYQISHIGKKIIAYPGKVLYNVYLKMFITCYLFYAFSLL